MTEPPRLQDLNSALTAAADFLYRQGVGDGAAAVDDARRQLARPLHTESERHRLAARIAMRFHEVYEELAPTHGYRTREESAKPWEDVPDTNKRLMVDTVRRLLEEGTINA